MPIDTVDYIDAPAYWASYLINADASGIDDADAKAADMYFKGYSVLDVSDDTWFSWSADLCGSTSKGDTLATYTVRKVSA